MSSPSPNQKSHHTKRNILFAITGVIIILVAGFFIYNANRSYPLGDGLEYIGATHSGTIPFLSDSSPSASYHYATDMTPEDVVRYFKKAVVDDSQDLISEKDPSLPITFSLRAPNSNIFYVTYYKEGQARIQDFNLKKTGRQHVLIILDDQYHAAKDSL